MPASPINQLRRRSSVLLKTLQRRFTRKPRSRPAIPIEICEQIIDFAAYDIYTPQWTWVTLRTLQACGLTCRAWLPRSRVHLFRVVSLRCAITGPRTVGMFSKILQDNLFLHPVVHDVTAGQPRDKIPRLQLVSLQLAALAPKLERLCLRDGSFYAPPAFRVMVRQHRSLASLFIKNVSFYSVGDVVQLLSSLTQLKHFRMSHVTWGVAGTTRPFRTFRKTHVRLSSLYVEADGEWIADARTSVLLSWFVQSGLVEALTVADLSGIPISTSRHLEDIEAILRCSARSLVFTSLKFSVDTCPSMLSNALSTISQLRTFYLFIPDHLPSLVDVEQLFSALSCTSLRDIRICLERNPVHTTTGRPAALKKMDRALQLPQYSSLRRVTLDRRLEDIPAEYFMNDFCHPWEHEDRRRIEISQLFSLTHKRGILWYWPVMSRGPVHLPYQPTGKATMTANLN